MENRDKGLVPDKSINKTSKDPGDGRGFVTPDGKFLNRNEASKWLKKNEPETFKALSKEAQWKLHSEDFMAAREKGKPSAPEVKVEDFAPHADMVEEAKYKTPEDAHEAFKEEAHPDEKPEHFLRRKICGG